MINVTEELKQYVDNHYFLKGLTNTPFWKDCCGHPPESYICSFIAEHIHQDRVYQTKFDLYVFNQPWHGQELCLRDGPECGDYCSPGSITDFIIRHRHSSFTWRRGVADLLCHLGRINWELRDDFKIKQ